MSISDYVIDLALIALVLRQVRERRLTPRSSVLPLAIAAWAVASYFQGVPTAGNDLVLAAAGAAAGIALGSATGLVTRVRRTADGEVRARAGTLAAGLWVVGTGARFAFQLYATHGGAGAIGRFSLSHGITSTEAWVDALLFMAVGEVVARSAVLAVRRHSAAHAVVAGA